MVLPRHSPLQKSWFSLPRRQIRSGPSTSCPLVERSGNRRAQLERSHLAPGYNEGVSSLPGPGMGPSSLGLQNPPVLPRQLCSPAGRVQTPRRMTTCLLEFSRGQEEGEWALQGREETSVTCGGWSNVHARHGQPLPRLNFPQALQDGGEAIIVTAIVLRDGFPGPYLPGDIGSRDLIAL